jgi:iron complex outermembrane receptor protein
VKPRHGLIVASLWAGLAGAGDASLPEMGYFDDLPLVLTASRIAQTPLDAPAPVTVLDRETIRASGFTEIQDLLRLVPGFQVADWSGGSANVVNHGMGDARSGRLQVLIDGRSVYNPFTGRVEWDELPLRVHDIERIEVVRGAAPATYGANAFQGVVNIITRDPLQDPGYALILRLGNPSPREIAGIASGQGERLNWRVSLSRRSADNFDDVMYGDDGENVPSETMRRDVLNARVDYALGGNDELGLQLGFSSGDDRIGAARISRHPIYTSAHDRSSNNQFIQASYRHAYGAGSELTARYYYYRRHTSDEHLGSNLRYAPVEYWFDLGGDDEVVRHDLELQQTHHFSDSLTTLLGLGVRQDRARSDQYMTGQDWEEGTQWQAFANVAWRVAPDWLLNLGGMLEKHYYTDWLFSPRLAMNYSLAPTQSLRFSAGRGYRAPTMLNARAREMTYFAGTDQLADVELWSYWIPDPEEVRFIDLGYVARFPGIGLGVDARIYQEDYSDYIDDNSGKLNDARDEFSMRYSNVVIPVPPTVPDVPDLGKYWGRERNVLFYNMGGARARGAEIQLDWRSPVLGRFLLGYALTDIKPEADTALMEQDFADSAPTHSLSLLWSKALGDRMTINLGHYRVDGFYWLNSGDFQDAYHRTDLKLAWRLGQPGAEDEISLTAQNLGEAYSEFRDGAFHVERRVFVTLRLGW